MNEEQTATAMQGTVGCSYCGWKFTGENEEAFEQLTSHKVRRHAAQLRKLEVARKQVFAGLPERWELEDFGGWVYSLVCEAQEREPEFGGHLQQLRRALELWGLQELFFPEDYAKFERDWKIVDDGPMDWDWLKDSEEPGAGSGEQD